MLEPAKEAFTSGLHAVGLVGAVLLASLAIVSATLLRKAAQPVAGR